MEAQTILGYQFNTWDGDDGLKKRLKTRYKKMMNDAGAIEAVMGLQQKPDEPVADFFARVVHAIDQKTTG